MCDLSKGFRGPIEKKKGAIALILKEKLTQLCQIALMRRFQ